MPPRYYSPYRKFYGASYNYASDKEYLSRHRFTPAERWRRAVRKITMMKRNVGRDWRDEQGRYQGKPREYWLARAARKKKAWGKMYDARYDRPLKKYVEPSEKASREIFKRTVGSVTFSEPVKEVLRKARMLNPSMTIHEVVKQVENNRAGPAMDMHAAQAEAAAHEHARMAAERDRQHTEAMFAQAEQARAAAELARAEQQAKERAEAVEAERQRQLQDAHTLQKLQEAAQVAGQLVPTTGPVGRQLRGLAKRHAIEGNVDPNLNAIVPI